jgi:pimeloyl-ACP methyl ester carboxylesterase
MMGSAIKSDEPVLLFLHGVGTGDPAGEWKKALSASLERVGYPSLDSARVIAPRYAHALRGLDEAERLPDLIVKQPGGEAAKKNRREFERRIGAIEFRLGHQDWGKGIVGAEFGVALALAVPFFSQARNYLRDSDIRANVLNRVLSKVPERGRIMIVGHSLGSVIAADVIRRLPVGVRVAGMVTIGSPLASATFGVDKLRDALKEPPPNLDWWVSFWNGLDPVAARRGVSAAFPWMIDFRVPAGTVNLEVAHRAVSYLSQDQVAEAVGFGLFGSRSKELARRETSVDAPLNEAERVAVLALRYAHLVVARLSGDLKDRYRGALRNVQANVIDALIRVASDSGMPVPSTIAELAVDLSDPASDVPEPRPARFLSKEEAVVPLTVLVSDNFLRPYEITVPKEARRDALKDLTAELGLGSKFGADVFESAAEAQEALTGSRSINWVKIGAIGAGAVAVVIATGGLALAAAPGVVGAAAITSALAAFGPGGMIGGLITAGALVTAGGGGIAFGLASQGTSAEALELIVMRQLAAEILRWRQGLASDPHVWQTFVQAEIEVRRERERLDEFSDPSAAALKELSKKVITLERALARLESLGVAPDVGDEGAEGDPEDHSPRGPWFRRVIPARVDER